MQGNDKIYRSMDMVPQRAIVDTNMLLDASFIADGYAEKALRAIIEREIQLYATEESVREAKDTLSSFASKLHLPFDPTVVLDARLKRFGVLILPNTFDRAAERRAGINKSDTHIAAAARGTDAWVLTGDMPLMVQLENSGIPNRSIWDVLSHPLNNDDRYGGIDLIMRMGILGWETGFYFVRATVSPAQTTIQDTRCHVFDSRLFGRVGWYSATIWVRCWRQSG